MTKLSNEEIKEVSELKTTYSQIIESLGTLEIQLINLNLKKEELKVELLKVQNKEIEIAQNLEEKYGSGTISLETGEFSPDK